jgi:hypothetical protein
VLVEHGFVTNPAELRWLKAHVEQLAQAECNALRRFFGFTGEPASEPLSTGAPALIESSVEVAAQS